MWRFGAAFDANDPFLSCWRFEFYGAVKIMAYSVRGCGETFQMIDFRSPE
jgi:hypothetical protein